MDRNVLFDNEVEYLFRHINRLREQDFIDGSCAVLKPLEAAKILGLPVERICLTTNPAKVKHLTQDNAYSKRIYTFAAFWYGDHTEWALLDERGNVEYDPRYTKECSRVKSASFLLLY